MTKTFEIRNYHGNDKPELLKLIDLNTPAYFAFSEKADFKEYLENERELYFVMTFEDKIIGCGGINFEEEKTTGIISWDIIHPNYQEKGFGRELLHYRVSVLKSIATIQKIVVRTSQHTNLFYQKQGFELKEIVPNYWAEGFDLYFMIYGEKL